MLVRPIKQVVVAVRHWQFHRRLRKMTHDWVLNLRQNARYAGSPTSREKRTEEGTPKGEPPPPESSP